MITAATRDETFLQDQWKTTTKLIIYESWNFNSGNYLFTTHTK